MAKGFEVRPVDTICPEIDALIDEAVITGSGFMEKLRREWHGGGNRFGAPGEIYLAVWRGEQVVALGGLNRDPYCSDPAIGRVRHVYVARAVRRSGVGRILLDAIAGYAGTSFERLRLRTSTAEGASFYEAIGFARCSEQAATHVLELRPRPDRQGRP